MLVCAEAVKSRPSKTLLRQASDDAYFAGDGMALKREYGTKTPNGNTINGRWVLRDASGAMLDFDQYRNDIAERNGLELQ